MPLTKPPREFIEANADWLTVFQLPTYAPAQLVTEAVRMPLMTAAVPGVPVREELPAALDTYLEYVQAHAHGYRAFHPADAAGDQAVPAPALCWASSHTAGWRAARSSVG